MGPSPTAFSLILGNGNKSHLFEYFDINFCNMKCMISLLAKKKIRVIIYQNMSLWFCRRQINLFYYDHGILIFQLKQWTNIIVILHFKSDKFIKSQKKNIEITTETIKS